MPTYFGHLMWRVDSLEKTLMLGGIEGRRRRGWQRMRWLGGITDSMDMSLSELRSWWWTGRPGVLQFMGSQRVRHNWATELNARSELYRLAFLVKHLYHAVRSSKLNFLIIHKKHSRWLKTFNLFSRVKYLKYIIYSKYFPRYFKQKILNNAF